MRVALTLPNVSISIVSLVSSSWETLGLFLFEVWSQTGGISTIHEVVRNALPGPSPDLPSQKLHRNKIPGDLCAQSEPC